jgi:hypothetical protein
MEFSVRRYSESDAGWWDEYVWKADNGNLFNTRRFLSNHPKDRFTDNSLIFLRKGKVRDLLPAEELKENGIKTLYSHRGGAYGGFVYKDLGVRDAWILVEELKNYASAKGFERIVMTLPPIIYLNRYSNYTDFALFRQGFVYRSRELSSIFQFPDGTEDILSFFKSEARTAARKSVKSGVEVRLSEDYEEYYEILKNNLRLRHNVTPTHTLKELKILAELFPERVRLWGAYLDKRMIAGVVNFRVSGAVTLAFYISDDKTFQRYRPVNQLFYRIFESCVEEGMRFYDFGIFTVNMDPNWGLAKFKEGFGARGIFRDTFEFSF